MKLQISMFGIAILLTAGCTQASRSSALPESAEAVDDPIAAIKDASASDGFISFRSWNGKWIGTDCDTEMELHSDGKAVLREYGYAIRTCVGTYAVTPAADEYLPRLTLQLNEYQNSWPKMVLYRDKSELLLMPSPDSTNFVFGNRAGATVPGDTGSFWPFRQIDNRPAK